jgi:hypothetical protein
MLPAAGVGEGDSDGRVVADEMESSMSSERDDDGEGEVSRIESSVSAFSPFLLNMFWVMRLWEKGVLAGRLVVEYSSTADPIAVLISSLDV